MSDVIVIIGCPLNFDKSDDQRLHARVHEAAKLFRDGVAKHIICSGRFAHRMLANPPALTEAAVMHRLLLAEHIPEESILLEDKSTDTASNAYEVKELLEKHHWKSLTLITSRLHAERAEFWFRKILGPEYELQLVAAAQELSPEEEMRLRPVEKEKIARYEQLLAHIPAGSVKEIRAFLRSMGEDR